MTDTPEREQAEALVAERDQARRERDDWQAHYERVRRDRDGLRAEAGQLRERAEKAEQALDAAVTQAFDDHLAAVERERELTRALESVRDVFPQGVCSRCAGFEFEVEEANRIIDKALAGGVSAAPDEDERAYCAECGRAGAPETLPMAYEECPPGAPCRVAEGGVSAAGRPPEQDLGGGTAAVAEAATNALRRIKEFASDPFASDTVALRACLLEANEALGLPGPEPSPERDIARAILADVRAEADPAAAPEVLPEETR